MKMQSIASPRLNLAQRILSKFGFGYVLQGAPAQFEHKPKRHVKRADSYGENLRAHFARKTLEANRAKRIIKGK